MGFHLFALYCISAAFRSSYADRRSSKNIERTAAFLISIPILFPIVQSLSDVVERDHQTLCIDSTDNIICQVEEMKLKVTRLESILEENMRTLNAKVTYLEEKEKQFEEMTHKLYFLQNSMDDFKKSQGDLLYHEERVRELENEVRLLWDESRKNNFNIHILEAKALDAEGKLDELASRVEKMEGIVTEQWIQIQQVEQALQIIEIRKSESTRCMFLKFIKGFHGHRLQKMIVLYTSFPKSDSFLASYISEVLLQFKKIMSAARKYHHQLQGYVKRMMDKNEFTAPLANKEVVFFMASALITFPVMSAWTLYSSCFS